MVHQNLQKIQNGGSKIAKISKWWIKIYKNFKMADPKLQKIQNGGSKIARIQNGGSQNRVFKIKFVMGFMAL